MTKRVSSKLILILVPCILAICLCGSYYLLVKRCLPQECAPSRLFDVFAFPLPLSLFPPGSFGDVMFQPSELDLAKSKGAMDIFWREGNGKATYIVWQFKAMNQASRFYQTAPRISHYKDIAMDLTANEYTIGCGFSEFSGYICELDARGMEFVFYFNVTISDDMTQEDFKEAVRFIDNQIKEKLSGCVE